MDQDLSQETAAPRGVSSLSEAMQWFVALLLAAGNFIAVMNLTITNVAIPTIAGNLGISSSQGTWVITFYAVAEAISVPLTGWFAARFGAVRVFTISMFLFGAASIFCGLSTSLSMLVFARILQGFSGGFLMPLSQTLLLRIFPKEKAAAAMALWSVATLVAPVVGPILGGIVCDDYSWSWAFYLNVPVAVIGALIVGRVLKGFDAPPRRSSIDLVGLGLLVVWVGSLQIMLDEGKDHDWFASTEICMLAVTAFIGFVSFLIWELTDHNPIVDLRVFRHRGFSASVLTLVLAFGAFFGINVLVPQWLQFNMGYTATWSGKTVAWIGVLAVFLAPLAALLSEKVDERWIVFCGIGWIGITTFLQIHNNTDMSYWDVALPFLLMGIGLPFFIIPVMNIALANVDEVEMDSAAGLMNFLRTLSGAFATSLISTAWEDGTRYNKAELSFLVHSREGIAAMQAQGAPPEVARNVVDLMVSSQSMMLATNHLLFILAFVLFFAAFTIWFVPKQMRRVDASQVTH
ncbi:MAG: DHA2 family efflux MFS transporter permease subunit [Bdellovibrionales bacterium]